MVDSVNIENVGGEAGIASEITLQRLLATMELMANKTGKDSAATVKKAKEQYKKSIEDLDEATKKSAEEKEKNTEATKKATKATKKYAVTLGIVTRSLAAFTTSIVGLTQEVISGRNGLADFTQHIPILGQYISVLSGYIDDSFSAFQTLAMSGAAFNNNLNELRYTAAGARLSLDQFTSLIQNNTEKLAALGGTATQGAKAMAAMTDQLGDQRNALLNMGFNFEEINEAMLDYAYMTRTQGRIEDRNTKKVAERAASYASSLQTLSKLTGESVEKLKEEQQAQQNDIAFQLKMSKMSAEEQEKVMKGMADAAAAGPAAVARFKEVILGMPPLTRATQLFEATMGEAATGIRQSAEDAMDAQVSANRYADMSSRRMAEITAAQLESARDMEGVLAAGVARGEGIGAELSDMLSNLGIDLAQFGNKTGDELVSAVQAEIDAAKEEQDSRSASVGVMANFNDTLATLRSNLTRLFVESGILEAFAKSVNSIIGVLSNPEVIGRIEEYLTSFTTSLNKWLTAFGKDPEAAWNQVVSDIGDGLLSALTSGLKSLFTNPVVIGVLGTSIAALLAKDAIVKRMGSAGGTGAGGAAGAAAGRGASGLGRGMGAGAAGLGRGIGAGVGGALKGIATGLAAFANSLVAIGIGVFSTAILAIGGAVAGATWMIGESLPNFAEGVKSFEDLDGAKLQSVGKGMVLLGGGLAAMGAGEVVGFFGKLAGIAGEGWDLLTGGSESPIEKLQKFASYNITQAQVDQIDLNVQALQTYATGMASLGAGTAMGAIGSIAEGIAGWFGDSPLEKIQKFADETINRTGLDNNLKAVKDFQTVFGEMSSSGAVSQAGLKKLDIDNVISYAEAIDELTEALGKMNEELSRDNNGFSMGKGTNAGDILGQSNKTKSDNDVNTSAMIKVLEDIRENTRRTLKAINESGNVH